MESWSCAPRGHQLYVKFPRVDEELYVYKYELPKGIDKPNNLELDEVEVTVTDYTL